MNECMILISELGANLRYEIYFEMRSELRTPLVETHSPNAKWFDDCLNVIRLYQTLEQPAFAAFSLDSDIRSGNRDNCDNTERDSTERPAGREIFWGEVYPGVNLRSVKMTENIAKITHSCWMARRRKCWES